MPKEKLKGTPYFHLVDPDELITLEELATWLEAMLHNPCQIWEEEGSEPVLIEIRQLVERLNGLRIEVFPNEHPPPHFHVTSPNVDASFTIDACEKLQGSIPPSELRKVRFWHKKARPKLIEAWNSTRPTSCVVKSFRGT